MRPAFSASSRRTSSVTVRGLVCSPIGPASFLASRFTRTSNRAITRTRGTCGMPGRSHWPARRGVGDEFVTPAAEPEAVGQLLADLRAARADLVRDGDDGHGVSLLPVLRLERRGGNGDALAGDVVEHID